MVTTVGNSQTPRKIIKEYGKCGRIGIIITRTGWMRHFANPNRIL